MAEIDIRKLAREGHAIAMLPARVPCLRLRRLFRTAAVLTSILTLPRAAHAELYSPPTVSSKQFFIAFCCVLIAGIAANAFLVSLVRPVTERARWQQRWEFSPSTLGGFSWRSLTLWSLLSLFMELLMIRWVSSEIRIFAYFKNFVLIACFLGFGLGCYLARRKINLLVMLAPLAVLIGIIQVPWRPLRLLITVLPLYIGASSSTQIWNIPSASSLGALAVATVVIVPIFGLIAFSFVPMGQVVGWYLENSSKGTLAYSVNVFAALCGIILYTSLCFLSEPPTIWFLVGDLLLLAVVWKVPRFRWATLLFLVFSVGSLTMRRGN